MPAATLTTQPGDQLIALLERKRMIDGAWVVCLLVVLGSVAFLWFLHVLEIDLARAAGWVFAYALVHLLLATLSDRLHSSVAVLVSLRAMILSSLVFLAFFWHLVGGLKHPMFLAVFTLPVIMSGILLLGSQAQITAAASVIIVIVVALAESADLRWYVTRLHGAWIAAAAAKAALVLPTVQAFPTFETGPAYEFALLETFAAVQFTVAFLSRPLAVLLVRVNSRLVVSGQLLTEVQGLFHAVLRAAPDPAVILYADSYQIVQASDSFFKRMLVRPSAILGKSLFEIIQFMQADKVRVALDDQNGQVAFCVYQVSGETRIANLYFYRTEHEGVAYVYAGWQEVTELYYLQTAFDAVEDPLLVIGLDSRLHYANGPARLLFGELYFGLNLRSIPKLATLLDEMAGVAEVEAGPTRHAIDGRPYDAHRLVPHMPSEAGACIILWFHCVAKEAALFEQAVRDPLTGVYNRRYFDDALERHIAKSKLGRQLVCAYFDLDYFKTINDEWGHAAGDAALIGFVSAVKSQLRAVDIFARRGGDEFAALFVNCDTQVAAAAVERIREILKQQGWMHEGQARPLSFSSGLAACHADDDVNRLLERTDKAVYAAKAAGKGRSVVEP